MQIFLCASQIGAEINLLGSFNAVAIENGDENALLVRSDTLVPLKDLIVAKIDPTETYDVFYSVQELGMI